MIYDVLVQVPLATFGVWLFIGAFQVYRGRTRTMTEVSFILGSLAWAGYALADWMFFHSADVSAATLMAGVSVSFVTVAAFFLLLFTKLFLTKPSKIDLLAAVPFLGALVLVWSGMVTGAAEAPWGWDSKFDSVLFLPWIVYIVIYASIATWYMYRTYVVVGETSQFLSRRVLGIALAFLSALVLGLGTNAVIEGLDRNFMPLFSSTLLFPGLITLYVLLPVSAERISGVMRKWKSRMYNILGVYLIYENGTLIASRTSIQNEAVDEDIFSATLDAIQTFMRTSFPLLLGKTLRRIEHGDVKILIERGRRSYLAVIIQGHDSDTLWIKMREAVARFEATNEPKLADWSGVTDELTQVGETLEDLFEERALFA